jgi:acetolactate synthase I/II/III large subunit
MCYSHGKLHRLLWCRGDLLAPSELLSYDTTGILSYHRLDMVRDPHDIIFDGTNYIIVSSGTNNIVWVSPAGQIIDTYNFPGEPDSWHINSLFMDEGKLYVSAFGRFDRTREWLAHYGRRTGIVFSLDSGTNVITGLEQPHHPKRLGKDSWLVCNSGKKELLNINSANEIVGTLQLEKWTRGLALSDKCIFVGESARRKRLEGDDTDALASIVVIDKASWTVIGRIALPFEEIYDLVLVPSRLLDGLRCGFRTNPHRLLEHNQHLLFDQAGVSPARLWAVGEVVPIDSCAVTVSVTVPGQLERDTVLELSCTVLNRGYTILVSAKPYPVSISYRWVDVDLDLIQSDNDFLSSLPGTLTPGALINCQFLLRTPQKSGWYNLEVSLFQRGRGFFGDLDQSNTSRTRLFIS